MAARKVRPWQVVLIGLVAMVAMGAAGLGALALDRTGSFSVVQVPAAAPGPADAPTVVWISGDGGWGKMERQVTQRLAARGVATIGVDSLRYFARRRTPDEAAQFVAKLVRAHAGSGDLVVVGFSFGADFGPFLVQALPADVRGRVRLAAFLSPSKKANMRVSPASWLGIGLGPPVEPVLRGLAPTPVLCVGGAGVFSDICGADHHTRTFRVVRLDGGHTFSGRYDAITNLILEPPHAGGP